MEQFLTTIKTGIATVLFTIGSVFAPVPVSAPDTTLPNNVAILEAQVEYLNNKVKEFDTFGASYQTPDTRALFTTTLASKITSSATSMTLSSATDKDGNTLASSTYGFIIDEGTSVEEFVLADCTGTACTNMTRGISVSTATTSVAALQFEHRRGASVKITTAPSLVFAMNVLKGKQNIEQPIRYNNIATTTIALDRDNLATAGLVADTAFNTAGVPNASQAARGVVEIGTASEIAAGTSNGGSGAPLVVPSSNSASTYNASSWNRVVVTDGNNKIDSNFISSSTVAFQNASNTFTATTTLSATTTIPNPSLVLNSSGEAFLWTLITASTSVGAVQSATFDITSSSTLLRAIIYIPTDGANEIKALRFNGDTGNNYNYVGSSIGTGTNTGRLVVAPSSATWSIVHVDIFGGSGATTTKYATINSSNASESTTGSAWWVSSSTEPIRSMTIIGNGGNIDANTKIWVFGSRF